MKLYFLVCVIFLAYSSANAQYFKGRYITGGSFSSNFMSPDKSSHEYNIEFDPKFGYYFTNRIGAGVELMGDIDKTSSDELLKRFGVGPFIRYNIYKRFFVEGDYKFLMEDKRTLDKDRAGYNYESFDENQFAPGVGYIFLITKHIAIEPKLKYSVDMAHGSVISEGPGFSIAFRNYI